MRSPSGQGFLRNPIIAEHFFGWRRLDDVTAGIIRELRRRRDIVRLCHEWPRAIEVWSAAADSGRKAIEIAQATVDDRCEELGIPKRFRPSIQAVWSGRGENAVKSRRDELRRVAQTKFLLSKPKP